MLRLQRALHTSRVCLQHAEASPVAAAKEEISSYLAYFKTKKDLRPLVYRKRNASELLSRDLWDAEAKKRVVPLDPPHLPSKHALVKLFDNAESVDELYELRDTMLALTKKPKYTTSYHINAFIEKSAELNKLPHALSYTYTQRTLKPVFDSSITNTIITLHYINPHKSLLNAISKAEKAEKFVGHKDAITDLLKASIYHKNQTSVPQELKDDLTKAEAIQLPSLSTDKSVGSLRKLLHSGRPTYITVYPIAKELAEEPVIKDLANVVAIKDFVAKYQEIQKKLDAPDAFEALVAKSDFSKPVKAVESTEEASE